MLYFLLTCIGIVVTIIASKVGMWTPGVIAALYFCLLKVLLREKYGSLSIVSKTNFMFQVTKK